MANRGFTFKFDPEDERKLQLMFQHWGDINNNNQLTHTIQNEGNHIAYEGRRMWLIKSTIFKRVGVYGIPLAKQRPHTKIVNSITAKYSKKGNDIREYVGFQRPGGSLAHILDKGTNPRYTKRGAYRGFITKKAGGPNHGMNAWEKVIKNEAPKSMQRIKDAIDLALKNF